MTQGTSRPGRRALHPAQCGPGTTVHSSADRRLAVEHWLLATLCGPGRDRARMEWQEQQVTLLPLGALLCAVRIPERVVHALARTDHPQMAAEYLKAALEDGPVIHDPRHARYYALVPASTPQAWHRALPDWRSLGVDVLGREALLGVPGVDVDADAADGWSSYWAVPMPSAGILCDPMVLARMMAAAMRRLTPEAGA